MTEYGQPAPDSATPRINEVHRSLDSMLERIGRLKERADSLDFAIPVRIELRGPTCHGETSSRPHRHIVFSPPIQPRNTRTDDSTAFGSL